MKCGLILTNAYQKLEHSLNQVKRLKEEFLKLGVLIDVKRNNDFAIFIDKCGNIQSQLKKYDFCIYLDKDKYISQLLEKLKIRLFNSHQAIENCDDKMTTEILLSNEGIKMPKTLPGLLCYNQKETISNSIIDKIEKELSYPFIIKMSYGSLGKEVYLVHHRDELLKYAKKVQCAPHLFQEFIQTSYGKDIRAIVIGKKFVTAMIRQSTNDFRSNIELGGYGIPFNADDEFQKMCEKIADLLHLDYCGIDVLFGKNEYYVCEVNSNAFFNEIEKVTQVNVAKIYAEYICRCVYENHDEIN